MSDDRRSVRLYSPDGVGVAALIGSLPAGTILLASNYRKLQNPQAAREILWYGFLGTLAMLLLALFLARSSPNGAGTTEVIITIFMYQFAKQYQGTAYEEHLRQGGLKASNWRAAGIGVLSLAGLLLTLYAVDVFVIMPIWGRGPAQFTDRQTGLTLTRPMGWSMPDPAAMRAARMKKAQQEEHLRRALKDAPFEVIATLVQYTPLTLHKQAIVEVFRFDMHRFPSSATADTLLQGMLSSHQRVAGPVTTQEFGGRTWRVQKVGWTPGPTAGVSLPMPAEIAVTVEHDWGIGLVAIVLGEPYDRLAPLFQSVFQQLRFTQTAPNTSS